MKKIVLMLSLLIPTVSLAGDPPATQPAIPPGLEKIFNKNPIEEVMGISGEEGVTTDNRLNLHEIRTALGAANVDDPLLRFFVDLLLRMIFTESRWNELLEVVDQNNDREISLIEFYAFSILIYNQADMHEVANASMEEILNHLKKVLSNHYWHGSDLEPKWLFDQLAIHWGLVRDLIDRVLLNDAQTDTTIEVYVRSILQDVIRNNLYDDLLKFLEALLNNLGIKMTRGELDKYLRENFPGAFVPPASQPASQPTLGGRP